jgi:adenosylcobinamide kinase/adenosylcobinamide-phosphate guanylyltransferase
MTTPNNTTLILGGCRSGKSGFALSLAERLGGPGTFIATCEPRDEEMLARIRRHQEERSAAWTTIETPLNLPEAIRESDRSSQVTVVDCLTLWVSNLLLVSADERDMHQQFQELHRALETAENPTILVSNEIGLGVVPDNAVARQFRDLVGELNQQIALHAARVFLVTAGIPTAIKGGPFE